jgi:hypothetical protein
MVSQLPANNVSVIAQRTATVWQHTAWRVVPRIPAQTAANYRERVSKSFDKVAFLPAPLSGLRSSPKASTVTISNASCPRKRRDPQHHSQAPLPACFLAGRGIGVTPTCSSAVYGAP